MEEIRLAGYFDLEEIEYAILENNGQLSFLTANSSRFSSNFSSDSNNSNNNTTDNNNSSSNISPRPKLPVIYVLDGKLNKNSLTKSGKDDAWIERELKKHNISNINNVILAMTDTTGKFIYQLHDEYEERCTN